MNKISKIVGFIFGVLVANVIGIMAMYLIYYLVSGFGSPVRDILIILGFILVLIGVWIAWIELWKNLITGNSIQKQPIQMNPKSKKLNIFLGIVVANLFAFIVIGLTGYFLKHFTDEDGVGSGFFIYSEFVLIPTGMGIICAWFCRNLELGNGKYLVFSLLTGLIAIGLSYFFLGEGYICLVIVSPLLFGFIITGAYIGKAMFRKKNNTLNVSVISLLFLMFTMDALSVHNYQNEVSDTILIHARPDEVWKHVVAFDRIKTPNHYWLFNIGMPTPVESTVEGYYEGAGRKCIFSNGYTFDEKMVVYKPNEDLTFDVINQPRDPEIMGHIDILRGQFVLHDNGDGTTTLTGNSWYRLYVFPVWYYDIWAKSITRNVHLRVMEHIKELSEMK